MLAEDRLALDAKVITEIDDAFADEDPRQADEKALELKKKPRGR